MRFTTSKDILLGATLMANRAIANKSSNPILLDYKIELTVRGVEMTSSNADMSVFTVIPMKDNGMDVVRNVSYGSVLVRAQLFTNVIRKLEGKEVTVEVIDNAIVKIDDGISIFRLNCIPGEEYPDINMDKGVNTFEVNPKDRQSLISQTAFAALDKDTRPILNAINLKAENGVLTATATDSARLSRKTIDVDPSVRLSCNVPAKNLSEIVSLIENAEEVEISSTSEKIFFYFGNTLVSSRLIPGDYPVSSRIIPQTFNCFLEIGSQQILSAVDRISVVATERAPVIKLTMDEDMVEVSSASDQSGSGSEKMPPISYNGDRLTIAFNAIYVAQAVRALNSESVVFSFLGEMKPFVIKDPKNDSVVELITPMRTR